MRAVLDTNVLVRATKNASGPARELLRQFESEQHVLIVSNVILVELLRVLDYPRVRAMHRLTDEECLEFIRSLHDAAEFVAGDEQCQHARAAAGLSPLLSLEQQQQEKYRREYIRQLRLRECADCGDTEIF